MRTLKWVPTLALVLYAGGTASAQTFILFGGGNSTPTQNQVVNTTQVAQGVPIATPQTLSSTKFSLSSFIPSFRGINNTRVHGASTYPTAAQMPGAAYLSAFKYGRGVPVVP